MVSTVFVFRVGSLKGYEDYTIEEHGTYWSDPAMYDTLTEL
jgi:hypothetical protein